MSQRPNRACALFLRPTAILMSARFMEGAKAAYEMILEAFWKGDREELKSLCDEDVYESFCCRH